VAEELMPLWREARAFKSLSFAPSTKTAYKTHLMTFLRFCFYYDVTPVPVLPDVLSCYVAHLARTLLPTSINVYLNIIRIIHLEAGFDNPLVDNFELQMIKRGINRAKGVPPKQKAPLTVEMLVRLSRGVDLTKNSEKAFLCALLIGFFGFLRKASLFPVSDKIPVGKRLSRQDVVHVTLDSFELLCHHSKTIQFGQKVHTIPYTTCSDLRICPVFAVLTHLGANALGPTSPLFNYVEGGRETFFSHVAFVTRLKAGIRAAGYDPKSISCHSLRRGGASLSFECGLTCDQIKLRGDWASECYRQYIVVSPAVNMEVARVLSRGASALAGKLV
jgi:hypothetical protein